MNPAYFAVGVRFFPPPKGTIGFASLRLGHAHTRAVIS